MIVLFPSVWSETLMRVTAAKLRFCHILIVNGQTNFPAAHYECTKLGNAILEH